MSLHHLDTKVARPVLFIIYFWFGILKVFGLSPASTIVYNTFEKTIPIIPFGTFIILFGLFECLIGILFLIPRFTRVAVCLLFAHIAMTLLPLFILTQETWQSFLVPTMEGQYIIKNLLIIALAITVASHIHKTTRVKN